MPFSPLQRDVAAVALEVAAAHGFVLGGGNALILHGIVDRYTADVDLVTDRGTGVKAASGAVEDALRAAGFQVERQDRDSSLGDVFYGFDLGFAEWVVTGPGGEQTVLQLAHFDRTRAPVFMDVGPVLNPLDSVASKVRAWLTRSEERDVLDVAAALERYSVGQLMALARELEPGLEDEDFADAGRRLDGLSDTVFRRYGLGPQEVARLRERFVTWPRS
jgi:nucleotidyltransferase AbiEii toxin of type IV toxin-antitoxin system